MVTHDGLDRACGLAYSVGGDVMDIEQMLLPCPFCGGDNVTVFGPVGWYRDYGISHSCAVFYNGTGDFTVGAKSKAQAIAAWNRRANLPSIPQ